MSYLDVLIRPRPRRFLFLLISISLILLVNPFIEDFVRLQFVLEILFTLLLASGAYAVSQKTGVFIFSLFLLVPATVFHWMTYFKSSAVNSMLGDLFAGAFLVYVAIILLASLIEETEVSMDVIMAAICVYLLMAFFWSSAFSVLEYFQPGSFQISNHTGKAFQDFTYFSFVTLTTLGYGDIVPLTPPAKAFSSIEAVMGQIYIATLVARLVAIHTAQSIRAKQTEDKGPGKK